MTLDERINLFMDMLDDVPDIIGHQGHLRGQLKVMMQQAVTQERRNNASLALACGSNEGAAIGRAILYGISVKEAKRSQTRYNPFYLLAVEGEHDGN